MEAVEVEEVDLVELARDDPTAVTAFEQALWTEQEPAEPQLQPHVAVWLASRVRANTAKHSWVVRGDDGSLHGVASLELPTADNLHLAHVDVRALPGERRRGIGRSLLHAAATGATRQGRTTLVGFAWDLVPAGEAFARASGARPGQVNRRSDLDLRALDRSLINRWMDAPAAVRERYELWTVIGFYPEDQYEAIAEVERVMNTAPHDDLDVEDAVHDAGWVAQRERQQAESPGERWTTFVRERATGRLVGYTVVFFYEDWPGHVDQGNTGVHPDHRGHGLGRWLKAAMIDRTLRERPDSFRIRTMNVFSNAPDAAINDELGFAVTASQTAWQAGTDEVLRLSAPAR